MSGPWEKYQSASGGGQYDTKLDPGREAKFSSWKAQYAPNDSGADYDLRGAFQAGLTPDPQTGHWPDTYKKPNHPTFSNESQYAAFGNPGHWNGETYVPGVVAVKPWERYGAKLGPKDVPDMPSSAPQGNSQEPDSSLTNKVSGGMGALATAATGATTGLLGRAGATLGGIAGQVAMGDLGTQEGAARAAEGAEEGAQKLTYTRSTPESQSILSGASGVLDQSKIAGLGPLAMPQLGKVSTAVAGAKGDAARVGAVARQEGDLARMAVENRPGAKPSVAPSPLSPAQTQALDTLERFAGDPNAIAKAKSESLVQGSRPTLAETTENPGLAQLQRAQQSKSTDFASDLQGRKTERLRARETAMESISGSEGEMEYFKDARRQTTEPLYKAAYETPIDPKKLTPELRAEVAEFMQRPTVQEARAEAIKKARDSGEVLGEQDMGSVKGMHYMKRAIDDKISAAKRAGADDQARIYLGIQEQMVSFMQEVSPQYAKAMAEYESASKPINRLEVGQYLRDKLFPASNQYGGGKMTVGQFAKALEHPDETAKLATGFSGAKMEKILTKDEISQLKSIAKDIVREQNVEGAARISGSPTAQLTAGQQRLESFLDKLEKVPSKFVSVPAKGAKMLLEKSRAKEAAAYESELNKMLTDPDYARSVADMRNSHRLRSVDPQATQPWNIGLP